MTSVTEQESFYNHLEDMSIEDLLQGINAQDKTVASAVELALPQIEALCKAILTRMEMGGRLFYIGAGTSGRLGIVDASECPPTFGVDQGMVVGIIAGGDGAIRKAVEYAEDDPLAAWNDLKVYLPNALDTVIGIAASGRTPYAVGGLHQAKEHGLLTGAITCNPSTALVAEAEYPVEVIVGPEFITGSTRMKAGTAQKMVLNMISTTLMIRLGRVKGNKMVDMMLTNTKLVERGTRMIMEILNISESEAYRLLQKKGSVRAVVESYQQS